MAAGFRGVPWKIALEAELHWVTAMMIIKGELDGGEFDQESWEWLERS